MRTKNKIINQLLGLRPARLLMPRGLRLNLSLHNWGKTCTVAAVLTMMFTGCIDEDLSQCGEEYDIEYQVQLHTNMRAELQTQLSTEADAEIRGIIEEALQDIFTDTVEDVELSFFDQDGLSHYEEHQLHASQASFQIFMPAANYMHHAFANRKAAITIEKYGEDSYLTHSLQHTINDSQADNHLAGVYSARLPMTVEGKNRTFDVDLYMVNAAALLVIDLKGLKPEAVESRSSGFAHKFEMNDSVFHYDRTFSVKALQLQAENRLCCYTVTLPSRDNASRAADDESLWQMSTYVTMNGGTTENVFKINEPLKAGNIKVIKAYLHPDGSLTTTDQTVAVSVTLDWKQGNEWDVPIN